jgi:hypothetical protein
MRILIAVLGLAVIGPRWAADVIVDQMTDGDALAFSLDGIDAAKHGPATAHKCVPVRF